MISNHKNYLKSQEISNLSDNIKFSILILIYKINID